MGPSLWQQLKMMAIVLLLSAVGLGWVALACLGLTDLLGLVMAIVVGAIVLMLPGAVKLLLGVGFAFWGAYAVFEYNWFISSMAALPVIPLGIAAMLWHGTTDLLAFLFKKKSTSDSASSKE